MFTKKSEYLAINEFKIRFNYINIININNNKKRFYLFNIIIIYTHRQKSNKKSISYSVFFN
jgi:hypothetical protein